VEDAPAPDVINTLAQLHADLDARFGPPERYKEFSSWVLGDAARTRITTHREESCCSVWTSDSSTASPRLLAEVRTDADLRAAFEAVELVIRRATVGDGNRS
jgi:hypothetical protein